jgi:hypothetical protein
VIIPPLDAFRAWLQVPATAISDEQLQQVLDAEQELQASQCRMPADPITGLPDGTVTSAQAQALYRRVGREVAARGVPLGMIGADSEYGPARLARWDSEVERLEGPTRKLIFA